MNEVGCERHQVFVSWILRKHQVLSAHFLKMNKIIKSPYMVFFEDKTHLEDSVDLFFAYDKTYYKGKKIVQVGELMKHTWSR